MEKYKILLVDDEEINIDLLRNALEEEYDIYATNDGRKSIDIMKKIRPDIVLLDVIMPKMDGFEVLRIVKTQEEIKEIPVILLTALKEIENKTKGFELGAVDYVTKPFYVLEIKSRIKTQLELHNSKNEIKILLSKTLIGAIQMLMEILSISNPEAFAMSTRIKNLVKKIAIKMSIEDVWKLEMAGMLSMLGCYALPVGELEKILSGQEVGLEEQKIFSYYPANGAKLISKIPRMEDISEIVNGQKEFLGEIEYDHKDIKLIGISILNGVLNFEMLKYRGFSNEEVIKKMINEKNKYNSEVLSKLRLVISDEMQIRQKEINIEGIEVGMIIEQDVKNKHGKIIIKQGMPASEIMIDHLLLLSRLGELENRISVRVK